MFGRSSAMLLLSSVCSLLMFPAQAQLIPDATLGSENSLVVPVNVLRDRIEGGATRGVNLFHSFQEFNVGENRSVYFANPATINNILTRVTGGNPSDILGRLGVLGEANLWLMNPNGIYFGPNASLDIRGSFIATTADGVNLGDTGYFSAVDIPGSQLLSVEPGALFSNALATHQREIRNRGNLTVGGDLTLAAGNLDLQGAIEAEGDLTLQATDTLKIRDTVNNPFIAQAGENLLIQGNETVDIFALNHPDSGLFSGGDLILKSLNPVIGDIHYYSGGNFSILNPETNTLGDLESPFDPVIRAAGDVTLANYTGASLHIIAGGSVKITGDVFINAVDATNGLQETVTLSDGTTLAINGKAKPTLDIRAGTTNFGTAGCTGTCPTFTAGGSPSSADITIGGDINVANGGSGGQVFLSNQYFANTTLSSNSISVNSIITGDTSGGGMVTIDAGGDLTINKLIDTGSTVGNSGDVVILSDGTTRLQGSTLQSGITTGIFGGTTGNAGDIRIKTGSLEVFNGAQLSAFNDGQGTGGNISLTASNTIRFQGENSQGTLSGIDNSSFSNNSNAVIGNITINTKKLEVIDGARITTSTFGARDSGDVKITASDTIRFQGESNAGIISGVDNRVAFNSTGNGGDIIINTARLEVLDGAQIDASTAGQGNGGNLSITASDTIRIQGTNQQGEAGGVGSQVESTATGNAGNVTVKTSRLELFDEAGISGRTFGAGTGGNLSVTADNILMDNEGGITTESSGAGDSGNIVVTANTIKLLENTGILANTKGIQTGNGGDITVNTARLEVSDGARIEASTSGQGNGGNLSITASDRIRIQRTSDDGTRSGIGSRALETATGNAGNVLVNTNTLDLFDQGGISTETFGAGNGGDIFITAKKALLLNEGGIGANTTSTGNAGNIVANINQLELNNAGDKGGIGVLSEGTGTAGNININGVNLTLRNNSEISAETDTVDGGNITINLQEVLLLRTGSRILTNSGTDLADGGGNGGNITINAGFVIAVPGENSDITANAFEGNGGNIAITASAIYGLAFRDQTTPLSDITASSEFGLNGTLIFNPLNFPSEQGLNELPDSLVDAESIIGQDACALQDGQIAGGTSFTVTGRGGMPPSPNDPLSHTPYVPEWASLGNDNQQPSVVLRERELQAEADNATIRPAQGWVMTADGTVHLTTETSTLSSKGPFWQHPDCRAIPNPS